MSSDSVLLPELPAENRSGLPLLPKHDYLGHRLRSHQGPHSSTIKPAGIRGIRSRDKIRNRDERFIVGIYTHYTRNLLVDESGAGAPVAFLLRIEVFSKMSRYSYYSLSALQP